MDLVLDFVKQYWGILSVLVIFTVTYIYNRQKAIKLAKELILIAEKQAEDFALKTGEDKFKFVSENGYKLLPPVAKVFISQGAFDILIQMVFDKLIDWAEENKQ